MTTLAKIAEETGVTVSLVSKVLNGKNNSWVSEATKARILDTAERLKYHPNTLARGLALGRTNEVGLSLANPFSSYNVKIMQAVTSACAQYGLDVALYLIKMRGVKETDIIRKLVARRVDGLITLIAGRRDLCRLIGPAGATFPMVCLTMIPDPETPSVGFDRYHDSWCAANHLLEQGYRRIAYVNVGGNKPNLLKVSGMMDVLKKRNLTPMVYDALDYDELTGSTNVAEQILETKPRPDAIMASSDDVLLNIYSFLKQKGISIPGKMGFMGLMGVDEMERTDIPISTMQRPVQEMCERGMEILAEQMKNGVNGKVHQENVKAKLIVRSSTMRKKT